MSLESHHLWNIPDTDDVVKLCSELQFQEYTQVTAHKDHTWMSLSSSTRSYIITESQLTALHSF